MPDRDDDAQQPGPDEAALAIVARHALHDEELVAALAGGALEADDEAGDRTKARALVERCPACRAVHDDVAAITGALHAATTFTARAPRDFRLTVDDAHRLGGTVVTRGPLARLLRLIVGVARPVGASLAALGLVGVLVGSALVGAAGTARQAADTSPTYGGTTTGSTVATSAAPAAIPSSPEVAFGPEGSPKASVSDDLGRDAGVAPSTWLLAISALAIVLGVALFVFGAMAGRGREPSSPS